MQYTSLFSGEKNGQKCNLTDRNFGLCLHFQHNLALFFFVQLRLSKQAARK